MIAPHQPDYSYPWIITLKEKSGADLLLRVNGLWCIDVGNVLAILSLLKQTLMPRATRDLIFPESRVSHPI